MEKENKSKIQEQQEYLFQNYEASEVTDSYRILSTPSAFAKENLWYVQEVGTLKSLKPHTSQRESLDSFLFMIVLSGKGTFTYDEKKSYLKTNDIIFINCQKKYSHRSSSTDPWELIWVHFNGPLIYNYYKLFQKKRGSVIFHSESSLALKEILLQLIESVASENPDSELLSSHLLNTLVTKSLTISEQSMRDDVKSSSKKIFQIKKYIDEHFKEKLTLDNLSHDFYVSKYHMSREFKTTFGTTINNYIINRRTTLAKELLRFTDKSIEEIGQECGINDNSYFNKLFQKVEKLSPSEYRKKWRGIK
ncbi:AraC family transcriptional regulator [Pisciglobus halotolerans]|uniref:AraC-type DNA-binding protein n=1 Tax=Pisciglobus halotolerans TaxID=745365 RepID=A0A1I3DLB3_9LACT|nr:helix-turn-helix domain-containing protein [Pisciglobus halotolerans]SFH87552.1 AraC-type DNA-binding protein [Pisciglobus halotolerans]